MIWPTSWGLDSAGHRARGDRAARLLGYVVTELVGRISEASSANHGRAAGPRRNAEFIIGPAEGRTRWLLRPSEAIP
jgi:hypothetical protein